MSQPNQHTQSPIGGLSRPDYSYRDHLVPPAPQVYEGDAYVGDAFGRTDVEVLPLLGEEDGMVIGRDGKLHSTGVAHPTGESFDHATGNFNPQTAVSQSAEAAHAPHRIPVRQAAPGAFAVHVAVGAAPRGNVYKSSAAGRHRV